MIKADAKKNIIRAAASLLLSALLLTAASFAWLSRGRDGFNTQSISASVIKNYFHDGDGSKTDPFCITRPVHYYNLVNLYQKTDYYANEHYYFQIGAPLVQGDTKLYVYDYDEHGRLKRDAETGEALLSSETLNLRCYSEANKSLLPIGTHDKSFLGVFDGNNFTLEGFTVSTRGRENVCDIGIFGYVGVGVDINGDEEISEDERAEIKNVYFKDITIDLVGVVSEVVNPEPPATTVHNAKMHTSGESSVAYAGYIAGHVVTTANISNVFINNVTVRGGGAATSRFGYFGCLESETGLIIPTLGREIATMRESGDGAGFGGSLDMTDLHERLTNVLGDGQTLGGISSQQSYPTRQTYNIAAKTVTDTQSANLPSVDSFNQRNWATMSAGHYIGSQSGDFRYVFGLLPTQTTQLTTVYPTGTEREAVYLLCDGQYISVSGTALSYVAAAANAVKWLFDSNGHYYTLIGGTVYYLDFDTETARLGLKAGIQANMATAWQRNGDGELFTVNNNVEYYIKIKNGLMALSESSYKISDGNGHFLRIQNGSLYTDTQSNATEFYFSNGVDENNIPQGTALYYDNGAWQTNLTGFDDGGLFDEVQSKFIEYDNGWSLSEELPIYLISASGIYLTTNAAGTSLSSPPTNSATDATKWRFENTSDINRPRGRISPNNNTEYYLNVTRTGLFFNRTYTLKLGQDSTQTWSNNNGILQNSLYTTRYLVLNDSGASVNTSGTALTFTPLTPEACRLNFARQAEAQDGKFACDDTMYIYNNENNQEVSTVRRSSCFPIKVSVSGDKDYSGSPLSASFKNTGYIVGGTYSASSGSGRGDIRVSSYDISNINGSYRNKSFSTLYTFNGSGTATAIPASNSFNKFDEVKEKFAAILGKDSSDVYGLHFMDSSIGMDRIIQAETATIMGSTYYNYDLPESCIDFNVYDRLGYITLMAGDYYPNNDSFFSLHQVFRNADNTIRDIKEIKEIYKKNDEVPVENGEAGETEPAAYLYRYTDNTWSDPEVTGSDGYTLLFESRWITNPRNGAGNLSGSRIYYFEIPCNQGEYALGSVPNKTGAYLLYLDVGANAGAVLESFISSNGNGLTNSGFEVDVRVSPDGLDNNSILQVAFDTPASDDFSITLSYDSEAKHYFVDVVNKSGSDVGITVFVCDNNNIEIDEFPYSYEVRYKNGNDSDSAPWRNITDAGGHTSFKRCEEYTIPAA